MGSGDAGRRQAGRAQLAPSPGGVANVCGPLDRPLLSPPSSPLAGGLLPEALAAQAACWGSWTAPEATGRLLARLAGRLGQGCTPLLQALVAWGRHAD